MEANRITDEVFENPTATDVEVNYSSGERKTNDQVFTFFMPYHFYEYIFPPNFYELFERNNNDNI